MIIFFLLFLFNHFKYHGISNVCAQWICSLADRQSSSNSSYRNCDYVCQTNSKNASRINKKNANLYTLNTVIQFGCTLAMLSTFVPQTCSCVPWVSCSHTPDLYVRYTVFNLVYREQSKPVPRSRLAELIDNRVYIWFMCI